MRWPWPRGPTLAEYADAYLATARPRLAPLTRERYETVIRLHVKPRLGAIPLRQATRADVRGFLAGLLEAGLGPATVSHALAVLRVMLAEAVEDGHLQANPAGGSWRRYVQRPRPSPRHLTEEQLRILTDEAARSGPPLDVLIGLAWRTGLRRGELLALTWNDVDLEGRTLRVHDTLLPDRTLAGATKGRRERTVDLSAAAVALLERHRAWSREEAFRLGIHSPEWLFWGEAGRPLLPLVLNQRFRRLCRQAGLPETVTLHGLRHTFATRALEAGARVEYVQEQMGHASISMTRDLYGRGARFDGRKWLERMEL